MMKKISTTLIIILFSLSGFAQERLIRYDSASVAWRQQDITLSFYDSEMARLLIPQNTQFGVVRVSSSRPESSLTYDSVNHTLVYSKAMESIYNATYKATTKGKRGNKKKDYWEPHVGTYTLAITDEQAQTLKKVWTDAIQNAEGKEDFALDGATWDFFIGNQRAKSHELQNVFVKFANDLMDTVYNGDLERIKARNSYWDKIKWLYLDNIDNICFTDTCQIKNHYKESFIWHPRCESKEFTIQGKRFFCYFMDIGSGQSIWRIDIYKQEDGLWKKMTEGKVSCPVFITAESDSKNNRIVFNILIENIDTYTGKIKSFSKGDEIGELSLSDW